MNTQLTAIENLNDFRPTVLNDRHERQFSLLQATGALPPPPYRVLDLGCGSGVTAVWAARKGWQVTAVDIEARFMAVLKDHLAHHEPDLHIEMCLDDLEHGEHIPEAAYDIVYLKDVLEHVKDYRACLATASRKLRPGGLVYIATTNVCCPIQLEYRGVGPYSWYPRWLKDRIRLYAMAHRPEIVSHSPSPALHWFSRRTLQQALREAGFQQTWDLYDLIRSPQDLTRRTRLIYPLIKQAHFLPISRNLTDAHPGVNDSGKEVARKDNHALLIR